jgi:hypothetical protein
METTPKQHHQCPFCDVFFISENLASLTKHIKLDHPKKAIGEEILRFYIEEKYPGLNLDKLVTRYIKKLETKHSLRNKNINIINYIWCLGVNHSSKIEIYSYCFHKPENAWVQTPEDFRKFYGDLLCRSFQKNATPEQHLDRSVATHRTVKRKGGTPENVLEIDVHLHRIIKMRKDRDRIQAELDSKNGVEQTFAKRVAERKIQEILERIPLRYLVSPTGEVVELRGPTLFAKKHGLLKQNVRNLLVGIRNSYSGWTRYEPNEDIEEEEKEI